MKPRFTKPPYQPKWVLQLQVFVLRLLKSKMFMIVTTTGRKTGLKRTIPIDYCVDGESFLAFNMGGKSNWYRNALANPVVTVEIGGKVIQTHAEPVPINTPGQLKAVLDAYNRARPGVLERSFGFSAGTPVEELMDIGQYAQFVRFVPV